ncbi:MAG: hypothetical protein V4484_16655 [Pseudomonadota bacterium]
MEEIEQVGGLVRVSIKMTRGLLALGLKIEPVFDIGSVALNLMQLQAIVILSNPTRN